MPKKSQLDEHQEQIEIWMSDGVPLTRIAENLGVWTTTLCHWIDKRLNKDKPYVHPLQGHAERITELVTGKIATTLYSTCAKEIQDLEYKGLWRGNGHHAAQSIQKDVMETIRPLLKKVIHAKVLR